MFYSRIVASFQILNWDELAPSIFWMNNKPSIPVGKMFKFNHLLINDLPAGHFRACLAELFTAVRSIH